MSRSPLVLGSLLLAALTYALAQTLVAPAIPALTREFGTSPSSTSWVLTGFRLSASVCTPLAGKLGDLFGKARVLSGVLVVFAAGSIVSALAGSIELVIAGRVIQGVAGGVFPLAFGIINDEFPAEPGPEAERAERILEDMLESIRRVLREGMEQGALRRASVPHTLQTLVGATVYHFASGEFGDNLLGRPVLSAEAVANRKQELRDLLHHGLGARPTQPKGEPPWTS